MPPISRIRRLLAAIRQRDPGGRSAEYWEGHNVTLHHEFRDAEESLAYFRWRNDQYTGYIERMPVAGFDGKVVLDFGCGPGNDLVGFATHSKPTRLIGMDVSQPSLNEARVRLSLHGAETELMHLTVHQTRLPLEDAALDHVHSSGVLHHTADPLLYLKEFYRLLRPGGTCRIMVYNRNSIWFHLYVAYQKMLVENVYAELSVDEAFGRFTDGEDCPVSRAYRPEEWLELCSQAGFEARYLGAAVSLHEADVFNRMRFQAAQDRRLPEESRRFLLSLTQDAQGLPLTDGHYAGVDACFELTR